MKNGFLVAMLFFSTATSAMAADNNLVALKGSVTKTSENRGFKEFLIQNAQRVANSASLPQAKVDTFVKSDFSAATSPKSTVAVQDCKEAVVVITAEKGNVLPNDGGEESYLDPEIVSFTCINN